MLLSIVIWIEHISNLCKAAASFPTLRSGQVQIVPNEIIDRKFSNALVGTNATYVLGNSNCWRKFATCAQRNH
ncbi:MAG: hypothetical protein IT265_12895 [Saprospiraceae bacterium]|nr:hypothetical protein [Saprospiraceae bacterium]